MRSMERKVERAAEIEILPAVKVRVRDADRHPNRCRDLEAQIDLAPHQPRTIRRGVVITRHDQTKPTTTQVHELRTEGRANFRQERCFTSLKRPTITTLDGLHQRPVRNLGANNAGRIKQGPATDVGERERRGRDAQELAPAASLDRLRSRQRDRCRPLARWRLHRENTRTKEPAILPDGHRRDDLKPRRNPDRRARRGRMLDDNLRLTNVEESNTPQKVGPRPGTLLCPCAVRSCRRVRPRNRELDAPATLGDLLKEVTPTLCS